MSYRGLVCAYIEGANLNSGKLNWQCQNGGHFKHFIKAKNKKKGPEIGLHAIEAVEHCI